MLQHAATTTTVEIVEMHVPRQAPQPILFAAAL
jgi:hypothetical protein